VHGSDEPSTAWWAFAVIYQTYPRSFMDSPSGNGVGDLRGIIPEKLPYVASPWRRCDLGSPFLPIADEGLLAYDGRVDYRQVDSSSLGNS